LAFRVTLNLNIETILLEAAAADGGRNFYVRKIARGELIGRRATNDLNAVRMVLGPGIMLQRNKPS